MAILLFTHLIIRLYKLQDTGPVYKEIYDIITIPLYTTRNMMNKYKKLKVNKSFFSLYVLALIITNAAAIVIIAFVLLSCYYSNGLTGYVLPIGQMQQC